MRHLCSASGRRLSPAAGFVAGGAFGGLFLVCLPTPTTTLPGPLRGRRAGAHAAARGQQAGRMSCGRRPPPIPRFLTPGAVQGKTTLIHRFLEKTDEPAKPTLALEFTFGRKSRAQDLVRGWARPGFSNPAPERFAAVVFTTECPPAGQGRRLHLGTWRRHVVDQAAGDPNDAGLSSGHGSGACCGPW